MKRNCSRVCLRSVVCITIASLPAILTADVITPIGIRAASEWGINIFASKLIDGSGLIDVEETPDYELDDYHDNSATWDNGWHAGDFDVGIPGGTDDDGDLFTVGLVDEQILEFDLGMLYSVTHAHIWQQNQSGLGTFLAPDRGVDEFEVLISEDAEGDDNFTFVDRFNLEPEEGIEEVPAQVIKFDLPIVAQRIRFDIKIAEFSELDNEFVGLGEVRFEGTPVGAETGDFDGNGVLDVADINALTAVVIAGTNDPGFDLNNDSLVTDDDRTVWVDELKGTFFGDSNLDGEFNSTDFVVVFTTQEYEDGIANNSTWGTGDWNGDGEFDSSDFVRAFISGGYEKGPRTATIVVPESNAYTFVLAAIGCLAGMRRGRRPATSGVVAVGTD